MSNYFLFFVLFFTFRCCKNAINALIVFCNMLAPYGFSSLAVNDQDVSTTVNIGMIAIECVKAYVCAPIIPFLRVIRPSIELVGLEHALARVNGDTALNCLLHAVIFLLSALLLRAAYSICLLSALSCLLFAVCCLTKQLSAACCVLSTVCCLLSRVCRLLSAGCSLPSAVYCLLCAVLHLMTDLCCLLSFPCCLLFYALHPSQSAAPCSPLPGATSCLHGRPPRFPGNHVSMGTPAGF
jgi:hypothetical protein